MKQLSAANVERSCIIAVVFLKNLVNFFANFRDVEILFCEWPVLPSLGKFLSIFFEKNKIFKSVRLQQFCLGQKNTTKLAPGLGEISWY